MNMLLDWTQAANAGAVAAGGKGWQLGLLARLGVPVPEGFVVAADASRARRPGEPVPVALLAAVVRELERRGWTDRPLVVRSSAPQEDSAQASFAGVHHSSLNVIGAEALGEAIAAVWDSAWTPAATAYRQRLGIDTDDRAMAVVIMPLLSAVAAGVAFTADPVSGRDDQVVINAHCGLGEALVGGHADGDEYHCQCGEVDVAPVLVEQRLGSKAQVTHALPTGGTVLREAAAQQRTRAVLTPAQAVELARLVRDAADALDYARSRHDVEWVWDGTRFWIVQARPATAHVHYTYPALAGQPAWWSRGNTREILPDPLSPIDWGLCRRMVSRMLTAGYRIGGYPLLPGAQRAGLFHGRLYLETSLIQWEGYDAYGVKPAIMNRLIGGNQPQIDVPAPAWRDRFARIGRLVRYVRRSGARRRSADDDLRQARARADAWRRELPAVDNVELAKRLHERVATLRSADSLFFLQGSAGGTLSNLVDLVERHCPGEGQAIAAALLAGGEASVTAQQGYDLADLARVAAADAPALAWLRAPDRQSADWRERLSPESPFRAAFATFLERYGHRANHETYCRQPRWREQPGYLFDLVLGLAGTDVAALRERGRQIASAAWRGVRGRLPFWLRPVVRKLVRTANAEANQREAARSALMAYLEGVRSVVLAIGANLQAAGRFAQADNVFNLTIEEIAAAAEGHLAPEAAARRAARRNAVIAQWAREREPDVIAEHGTVRAPAAPAPASAATDEWRGTAVGAGRATGRARIVRDPREATALLDGDILVVPSTDPAWTPLFLKAGALVMETGGYLSHGAIVAREFGIPAVANLPDILARITDGDRVEVDGSRGTVRRLARQRGGSKSTPSPR